MHVCIYVNTYIYISVRSTLLSHQKPTLPSPELTTYTYFAITGRVMLVVNLLDKTNPIPR